MVEERLKRVKLNEIVAQYLREKDVDTGWEDDGKTFSVVIDNVEYTAELKKVEL